MRPIKARGGKIREGDIVLYKGNPDGLVIYVDNSQPNPFALVSFHQDKPVFCLVENLDLIKRGADQTEQEFY